MCQNHENTFKKMFVNVLCPLLCSDNEDTPDHLLTCTKLIHEDIGKLNMKYILENVHEQEQIGKVLSNLMRQRVKILKQMEESNPK